MTEEEKQRITEKLINLSIIYGTPERQKEALEQFAAENLVADFETSYTPPWDDALIRKFLYGIIKHYKSKDEYISALYIALSLKKAAPPPVIPPYNTNLLFVYQLIFECYNELENKAPVKGAFYYSKAQEFCTLYNELNAFMGCAEENIIVPNQPTILGQGSFGQVVLGKFQHTAEDGSVSSEEEVAIKIMRDEKNCHLFNQEIEILLKLNHPHIVQLLAHYREPERLKMFLVFKRLNRCLKDFLYEKTNRISWSTRFLWAFQLADAMKYMHSQEILHRDLKSKNMMLDENNNAVVIDLGLAITKKKKQTMQALQGTMFWIPPEILLGIAIYSEKTDVYSFGMTVYEIVTGDRPFVEPFPHSAKQKEVVDKNSFVNDFTNHVKTHGVKQPIPEGTPRAFSSILQRCWEEQRPSAEELYQELNEAYEEHHRLGY